MKQRKYIKTFKLLLPYLWPEKRKDLKIRVSFSVVALVFAKIASVSTPLVLGSAVNSLTELSSGINLLMLAPIALIIAYGAAKIISFTFVAIRDALFSKVSQHSIRQISLSMFKHLHNLSLQFHLDRQTGALAKYIDRGTKGIDFLLRYVLFNVVPTFFEIFLVAGILFYLYGMWYAIVTLTTIGLYSYLSFQITEWRNVFRERMNRADNEVSTKMIDSLLNFETVKYFNNEEFEQQRYSQNLDLREEAKIKNLYSLAVLNSGQALIIGVCVSIIMFMAANKVASGEMTIGDLAMINAFMLQVFIPLNALGFIYREIRRMLTDVEEMFKLLEIEPKIKDGANAKAYSSATNIIEFSHVNFGYSEQRQILEDVSFTVGAGEKVAIVGPSGSGKSTIAKLLFRFYEADSGDILVNHQRIESFSLASWRQTLGVVPQDTVLFNSSIGENISYGNPKASASDIEAVIALAHLTNFIKALPQGLDTLVGERGLKVSGGEKQRIAIARMLLKKPSILIFDEATSSLDSAAEQAIIEALDEVAKDHTTIVIAHRLSTIVNADKIIVVDAGRVVEIGDHTELLAKQGLYNLLWKMQQQEL